jgi:gliding motility-associated-like protein
MDSASGYNYLWSTGETTSQISIHSGGTYALTVTDGYGCEATASTRVDDACDGILYVPNAFTPNNDGRNDVLHCYGTNIRLKEFSVYDRWGKPIYRTGDISGGWDGKEAPEGLYIWKAVYYRQENNHRVQETRYGSVALLR